MNRPSLREANRTFLQQAAPALFKSLPAHPRSPGTAPKAATAPRFTARLSIDPPRPDGREPYLTRFVEAVLAEARAEDIPFFSGPSFTLSCSLVVLGPPQTEALMRLIRETRCIYLFVIVDDVDAFDAGLDQTDWTAAAAHVRRRGGEIFMIVSDDVVKITGDVYTILSSTAPWALDAMVLAGFGAAPLAPPLAETMGTLGYQALSTLGPFYDNCLMLRNSELNLRCGNARTYRNRSNGRPGLPAWIVGSGPSLDADLAFLKTHQDKAVVISCGSALAPLMAAGVRPDFHVELENVNVGVVLKPVAEAYDLSDIALIAPVTVDPVTMNTFKCVVFSSRQSLPPHALYNLDLTMQPILGEPTVSNLALAFARERNFQEICLFGTDMGARDAARDHAAGTWHRDPDSGYKAPTYDIAVDGNFGDACHTSRGLYQALHTLSLAVSHDRSGRRYVNCSDGAAITGALAVRSSDLHPAPPPRAKSDIVADILDAFPPLDTSRLPHPWPGPVITATVERQFNALRSRLRTIRDFSDKAYVLEIGQMFRFVEGHIGEAPPGPESAANILVRGTVGAHLLFMEYYLNRVTNPAHLAHMGQACVRFIETSLDAILADTKDRMGGDGVTNVPEFEDIRTSPDLRFPPAPAPARNAPCPCGSGKRFKQCHGQAA
tara:strand:- start:12 stop:2000 length:1989 start_codon:yes stop_codon:yes gene_type:complete